MSNCGSVAKTMDSHAVKLDFIWLSAIQVFGGLLVSGGTLRHAAA